MLESYGLLAVVLLVIGLAILVAEVFVPSGGVLAILTTITLCLALVCAYAAWYERYPVVWWGFCALVTFAIPATLGLAFYVLPRTAAGRHMLLDAPELENLEPHAAETQRLQPLIGKFGKTLTMLNPGGLVVVAGERLHAFSEGQLIDPGSNIEVLEVRGTRVLVRLGSPDTDSGSEAGNPLDSGLASDFELPTE